MHQGSARACDALGISPARSLALGPAHTLPLGAFSAIKIEIFLARRRTTSTFDTVTKAFN